MGSALKMEVRVLVVGSGVSGLACAKRLSEAKLPVGDVLVVDKGRQVGGRLSTVTLGGTGVWDKGAPFFTVCSDEFKRETEAWPKRVWCNGFVGHPDGHPRFMGIGGMRSIAQSMAEQLPYRVEQRRKAVRITRNEPGFRVDFEDDSVVQAQHVVLTAPVIQSLELVKSLDHPEFASLRAVRYNKTITCLFQLSRPADIPAPGGWQKPVPDVHFLASSRQKGLSERECLTVHFDVGFSDRHFDLSQEQLRGPVLEALRPFFAETDVVSWSVHRWRFAIPAEMHAERYVECSFGRDSSLWFCGDAFRAIAVEGSFLSGAAVGAEIRAKI